MTDVAEENLQIQERFIVDNLETLKVLADPLRLRIIDAIGDKPHTVKQVARMLNMPPNKLYYHVNMLEEHGLIRVVDTRIVSGIIEKSYLVAARIFTPARGLLSPGVADEDNSFNIMLEGIFEETRQSFLDSFHAGLIEINDPDAEDKQSRTSLNAMKLRLTEEQAAELNSRLNELVGEYHKLGEQNTDTTTTRPYRLVMAYFPMLDIDDVGEEEPPPAD